MRWFAIAALAAATGCATTFTGNAKVENGVAGCRSGCAEWGMELAGMVKVGEYSDGCICQVKDRDRSGGAQPDAEKRSSPPTTVLEHGAGASFDAAATGVYLQMLASQRNAGAGGTPGSSYVPHSPPGSPGWRPGMP